MVVLSVNVLSLVSFIDCCRSAVAARRFVVVAADIFHTFFHLLHH